ncbi:MAG TPA: PH domain-containing protein [Acidimicrobiia bacterium]|jgi:uncharacterized membrane protein YdbT with pleckstrin-like domain
MPYPKQLVNQGENVVLDLRPHWWYFSKHIFTGIPLLILLVLLFEVHGDVRKYSGAVYFVLLLVWALWLAYEYLQWRFTYFVVSDQRVVFRTGVVAKHGVEIPLERINNINFNQNIWNRIIGAGDLAIESAGREGQTTFDNVRHPDGVQQEIYRQMEVNARRQAGWHAPQMPAAAPASPSIADQIQQLATLRDQGHITPAEFEAKKAELLQRM